MVYFKENGEILIGGSAKNNITEYPKLQYLIVKD